MSGLLNVSSAPHIRSKDTTSKIMLYVIIALMPATLFGIWNFGLNALMLIAVTIASCVVSEYLYNKLLKKKTTVGDLSAVLTGLLLALNFPVDATWWMGVLGGIFAIVVVKMIFGGLGQNIMNPALGARCFLFLSYTGRMNSFSLDGVTQATPLAIIRNDGVSAINLKDMFLGTIPGTIGETSVAALLIGAIFLLVMEVIDLRIPATYIGTFVVFIALFGGEGLNLTYIVAQVCGGGLILGAFFMATDYVTAPITQKGKIVFGVCLGLLTGLFRVFGPTPEGVSYAIIFSNLLVPLIERVTLPKAFGKGGEK